MAVKHALIVDDSRSARVVLKRMLEELDLDVDAVESADDAINYLKKQHPDIIFMDHMMPGMDGFEALKLIKNNSQTAVIPVMMYTSRGGEVYLSQARELGAVGIIPKTISHVGLKESLFKLGLLDDRRKEDSNKAGTDATVPKRRATDRPASRPSDNEIYEKNTEYSHYLNDLGKLMDDQTIELHKSMWLGVESVSNEIFNRLNSELEERFASFQPEPDNKKISWPVYVIGGLFVMSIIVNIMLLSDIDQLKSKLLVIEAGIAENSGQTISTNYAVPVPRQEITVGQTVTETVENSADRQQSMQAFLNWAQNKTIVYPFDELALNDNRLPEIDELLKKAVAAGFSGSIMLQTHVGRFCLSRDSNGDYMLAEDDLPVISCDYIGNHMQPIDLPSTHQSLSFANYLSAQAELEDNDIVIDVVSESRSTEVSTYPELSSQTLAKQWNQAAQSNNRVTVLLSPEPDSTVTEIQQSY
jgi:CheY-like chemotaxis protein